jgi:hypothetical protein
MRTLLAIAALVVAMGTASAERMIALVQPKENSLVLYRIERKNDLFAKYKGRTEVSGTLVAEWVGGKDNLGYKEPVYSLVLDAASARRLPHFSGYSVRSIELMNGREALQLSAGRSKANLLLKRKVTQVKVTGSFVIRDYTVGVECDWPWATAILISAHIPDRNFAAVVGPTESC